MSIANDRRIQFVVRFGYNGGLFHGVQPQPDVPTAGQALINRLCQASGQQPHGLTFTARTDAGVWAETNYITCWFKGPLDIDRFTEELSIPRADGLLYAHALRVDKSVNARTMSRSKLYRYRLIDNCPDDLWSDPRRWQICVPCDPDILREAARYLVGTHDFSAFRSSGCTSRGTVKTITSIAIQDRRSELHGQREITFEITGTGFLRKMVRIMVGTMVEIAVGLSPVDEIQSILESGQRQSAGVTAPARGLTLVNIECEPDFTWPPNPCVVQHNPIPTPDYYNGPESEPVTNWVTSERPDPSMLATEPS